MISKEFPDLMKLSPSERIQLAQDLWDSIQEDEVPPLSEEQIQELERRLAEHERDPSTARPWEEVRASLRERFGA
jgi:putative addiction module component (TIGR02574 family)